MTARDFTSTYKSHMIVNACTMKRATPNANLRFPARSVRDTFTRSQLAEVGAVVLAWNHLELNLDNVINGGLDFPEFFGHEIIGRIHGIDGKIAIIRIMATNQYLVLSPTLQRRIGSTMSAVSECKTARDSVAHARALLHSVPHITQTTGGRGRMFDLLFTPDALSILVRRIEAVSKEVGDIVMLYIYYGAIAGIWHHRNDDSADSDVKSLKLDAARHATRLRRHQKQRLSLSPLPAFPKLA